MSDVNLENLSRKRSTYLWLYIGGALLLLLAVALWWAKVSVNPERVFWGTVDNSLATSGVTLNVNESNGQMSDKQSIQYSLGTTNQVHSVRTVKQGNATVKTESVGNATKTFTRYTSITGQSKKVDLHNIVGVWSNPTADSNSTQLLPQVALGLALPLGAVPMPIGTIPNDKRSELIEQMRTRSLYQVDYARATKESKDGRLYYTYQVSMQPVLYLSIMKSFAQSTGLKDFENVDPNQYAGSSSIKLKLTIDAHARQLVKVVSEDQGYSETYSAYGVPVNVSLPKQAISLQELQKRLAELK